MIDSCNPVHNILVCRALAISQDGNAMLFFFAYFRLGVPEAKKPTYELRTTTTDNSNNNNTSSDNVILSRSTATYDICPKTGKVYHRQETWLLTDRQRHARFKTEKSLLIKTTTRCMRMKAYKSQTYCCFRKCFKRRPKI